MSDIPEDIDRIATDIVREDTPEDVDPEWFLYKAIAEALMAERERAAKICDDFAKDSWGYTELQYAGEELARLIRSDTTEKPHG